MKKKPERKTRKQENNRKERCKTVKIWMKEKEIAPVKRQWPWLFI